LIAAEPGLAARLIIGRSDILTHRFDEGGLIDVKHVAVQILVTTCNPRSGLRSPSSSNAPASAA
jgi:hypothetical protein